MLVSSCLVRAALRVAVRRTRDEHDARLDTSPPRRRLSRPGRPLSSGRHRR